MPTSAPTAHVDDDTRRIFYAEDDDDIRALVTIILTKAGYATQSYADGASAYAAIDDARVHLFLMDVRMPGHTGLELCRHLRETRPKQGNPVLLCSAEKTEDDVALAMAAGADDFLPKPFTRRDLLEHVGALLDGPGRA